MTKYRRRRRRRRARQIFLFVLFIGLIAGGAAKGKLFSYTAPEQVAVSGPMLLAQIPPYSGEPYIEVNGDEPFFEDTGVGIFENYGELDFLGRCTGACVCVGPETLPDGPREDISSIRPSGWNNARYAFIDREYLFNRCHLVGFQLTGQNANERNLITGTRYLNIEGMLPFENSVGDYIRGTGHHVLYRVTPLYDGLNLIASGVLMEARSVEDPAVAFCVFCYNVQPGVEINYVTGESRAAR